MSLRPASQALRRRLAAGAAVALAAGTAALIFSSRRSGSRKLEQSTPLKRDQNGAIIPPTFPRIKTRAEHLADIRSHSFPAPSNSSSQAGAQNSTSATTPPSEEDPYYDLLVIGGGATGTGIALDAVTRGLKVALVERGDFASGTSSKSTKLVHGGVRYLEAAVWNLDLAQFQLVREALRERAAFLAAAPHLARPLPILLPVQRWWEVPYFWAGTKAYDLLAGGKGIAASYFLSARRAVEKFPLLRKDGLVGALVYFDGQHNDARMGVSLAMTASLYGASVINYVDVVGLEKDAEGRIRGARVRDLISQKDREGDRGDEFIIRARGVVNATGPFTDAIEKMDDPSRKDMVAPSSGVHVVLPGHFGPKDMGLLDPATSDGRVVFFLPWEGKMLAGTTDVPCKIEREPSAGDDDINFILKEVRRFLSPDVKLSRDDILATWSGIRPLVRDPNAKGTASLVRSHLVTVSPSGLLTCAGGKWTTYREMAQDAVDTAVQTFGLTPRTPEPADISGQGLPSDIEASPSKPGACQTLHLRLLGAHGFSDGLSAQLAERFGLDEDVADHLAANYGDRAWAVAGLHQQMSSTSAPPPASSSSLASPLASYPRLAPSHPFLDAEIRYAARCEMAQTAADVLARRTRLAFLDAEAALTALPRVVDVLGEELGWSPARMAREWDETTQFLQTMGLREEMASLTREEVGEGAVELRRRRRVGHLAPDVVGRPERAVEGDGHGHGLRGVGVAVAAPATAAAPAPASGLSPLRTAGTPVLNARVLASTSRPGQ